MGSDKYILAPDGKTPVLCNDVMEWGWSFENKDSRRVDATELHDGKVRVSTVFLGLDHSWGEGPPLLWETMIFGGPHNEYQERFSTYEDAVKGHAIAVELATASPP